MRGRGSPRGRNRFRVRFGSWNMGTLTGKSIELVKILKSRKVNIACIQETKWVGNKAREIDGFKLWYSGASRSKNGVGILVDASLREHVVEVRRDSDRIMAIKLVVGLTPVNMVCGYAPQVGLGEEARSSFWDKLDELVRSIPQEEFLVVG